MGPIPWGGSNSRQDVADRGNRRIQVFDGQGKPLRQITIDVPYDRNARPAIGNRIDVDKLEASGGPLTMAPGSPWTLCIPPGPRQVLYASDAFPGRVYKMTLDGQVVGWFGKNGRLPKEFGWIHELDCRSENEILAGELLNWRMSKITLHPDKTTTSASARH